MGSLFGVYVVREYDGLIMRMYFALLAMIVYLPVFASAINAPPPPASRLYRRHCVSCHGNDGKATTSKGKFSHARDLTDNQWQTDVSDERIFNSIMNGRNVRGNMPAFSDKLNENAVNSLVNFVRSFKGKQQ
jgi:cytochrome c6